MLSFAIKQGEGCCVLVGGENKQGQGLLEEGADCNQFIFDHGRARAGAAGFASIGGKRYTSNLDVLL